MKKFVMFMLKSPCAWCILSSLMYTSCFAQQPQLPTEYNVKLSGAEVDIVGKALGAQPYNDVAVLIQKLREQIVAQQASQQQNKTVEEKK